MNARLKQLWSGVAAFFLSQPPARRWTILGVGIASMAIVLGLAWWVQRPLYRPLFTNLSPHDAAAIVDALRAEKVAFEIEDGGRAVLVPAERLYELRLELASRGLPEGGGVGFEIFDRQTLGQTDFLERLNYQRALQGELGRTIGQLGGVESARVHLALPERSLFVAADRKPSASVVVKLVQGRTLARAQIDGIVHLVAASVEGMDADAVTVVDESGRILTPDRHGPDGASASGDALEYQQALERGVEDRIESMLGAVVGRDKVIARVAATLDFARVERTEETYDPDRTALQQSHTSREQSVGLRPTAGVAGASANLTNDANAAPAAGDAPKSDRRDETQTYEVSKVVSHTVAPVGAVKQLSVAVLVDGTYEVKDGKRTFVPRPAEEIDRLKALVKNAAGLIDARGDKVEVTSVPFQSEPLPAGEGVLGVVWRWLPVVATRVLGLAFAVVMLLYVVRPLLLGLAARPAAPAGGAAGVVTEMDAAMLELTGENRTLTQRNPERAAQLVRLWLAEAGGPPRA
ncbi:MAG TPA: flagellar basal-body MS-ring/collar protein FliF [Candidatus Binatia bacterium]|nr:flagellar basal-body MS-ring/collar protein FliF [Candidatus Binatia bacterium]